MQDSVLGAAGLVMIFGAAIWLLTKPWFPRVSDAALGLTCIGLGTLGLSLAIESLQRGAFKGAIASKILRHDVYFDKDPLGFWIFFGLFALPGFLLVTVPIYIALSEAVAWLRARRNDEA